MVLLARRSPRARLYSLVPRSSQWPSINSSWLGLSRSQLAFASRIAASPGLMSNLSKSKWIRRRLEFGANSLGGGAGAAVATCTGAAGAGGTSTMVVVVCVSVTTVGVITAAGGGTGAGAEATVRFGRFAQATTSATASTTRRMAGERSHERMV